MKKFLSLIIACILILSGCSNKATKESGTLKLGLPSGGTITPVEILDSFKAKHPNITVEVDETPWNEFKKKLKMQIATRTPPNVFLMDSGYVFALGGMGAAVDLSGKVKKDLNEEDYSKTLFAGKDPEGHLWGIPHGINSVAVYYNKALFDKAGLEYPKADWTFEEMLEMGKKLTKDTNGDGVIDEYGLQYGTSITDGWLPFVSAMGGSPLDENRKKSNFKDEKTIEGIKKYVLPQQMGISPSSEWIASNGNSLSAFYMGKLGMYMAQASASKTFNKNAPAGFNYDVQMLPIGWDGNRHCIYVPNLWCVFSGTTEFEKEASWQWIKHFLNEESQLAVANTLFAGYPIKKSALDYLSKLKTVPENSKAFYEGIEEHGVTIFENKTFEEWRPQVDKLTAQMRRGEISFDAGIEQIDKAVSEVLINE